MTGTDTAAAIPPLDLPAMDLPRLDPTRQLRSAWFARIVSAILLVAVVLQAGTLDPAALASALPATPGFWLAFIALYFTLPLADWIIFRRLWRLPLDGIGAILRKRISNELLLSYTGEVYFYLWARRRTGLTTAPFGAIKDVNIISALVANIATLALLAIVYPFITELHPGRFAQIIPASVAVMLAIAIVAFLFRGRLFTLGNPELRFVWAVHGARIVLTTGLLALVWHLAMPQVPLVLWLELSALRLVINRLPLMPSPDLLFTSVAIFLLGADNLVSALLTMTAALTLAIHILLALGFAIGGLFERNAAEGAV